MIQRYAAVWNSRSGEAVGYVGCGRGSQRYARVGLQLGSLNGIQITRTLSVIALCGCSFWSTVTCERSPQGLIIKGSVANSGEL